MLPDLSILKRGPFELCCLTHINWTGGWGSDQAHELPRGATQGGSLLLSIPALPLPQAPITHPFSLHLSFSTVPPTVTKQGCVRKMLGIPPEVCALADASAWGGRGNKSLSPELLTMTTGHPAPLPPLPQGLLPLLEAFLLKKKTKKKEKRNT